MDTLIYGVPVVAIIIGLTEVIKRIGLPKRLIPLVSVIIGVIIALLTSWVKIDFSAIIGGIVAGLTACGIWSGTKATIGK